MSGRNLPRNSKPSPAFALVALLLPSVSAVASYFAARNLLLVIVFALGASSFVALSRSDTANRDRIFLPLAISIGLSLLLSMAVTSDTLAGFDIHVEYRIFLQVSRTGTWNGALYSSSPTSLQNLYNSALSISVLPSVLSAVSGLDGVQIFKFGYPAVFCMVPMILYKTYRKVLTPEAAFLSVFLVMSYAQTFYVEMLQLARQETAEFLFLLLLLVFLSPKIAENRSGIVAITLLTLGGVVAHYSLTYIYISLLVFSFAASQLSRKIPSLTSAAMLLLSAVVAVCWYILTAGGFAVVTLSQFVSLVVQGLTHDFFNPSSRPLAVLQAIGGVSGLPGVLHDINRVTQYLVQLCLMLGFLAFMCRKQKSLAERNMFPIMVAAFSLLGCAVVLPFFAAGLNLSRIYHITLLFVSPCFVYGADWLESSLRGMWLLVRHNTEHLHTSFPTRKVLAATILCSYLLFNSGWAWSVSMDRPTSFILDRERMMSYPDRTVLIAYYNQYTVPEDVAAARWLKPNLANGHMVCADLTSRVHVLVSYGELDFSRQTLPSKCSLSNSYVYLSTVNTLYGIGVETGSGAGEDEVWNIAVISRQLATKNTIYSNGGARIYG